MIDVERYISDLEQILSRYFSVTRHAVVADRSFFLSAHHSQIIGRTLLTEKDVIDQYEECQIVLVQAARNLQEVLDLSRWLKAHIREIVHPSSERHFTLINLVVLFDKSIPDDVKHFAERYKLIKSFLFSLRGWAQAGLTCVCLQSGEVICGKDLLDMKQLFRPVPQHEAACSNPNPSQTDPSVVKYTPINEEAVEWQSFY